MNLQKKYIVIFLIAILTCSSVFFLSDSKSKYTQSFNSKVKIDVESDMASVVITANPSDAEISISIDGGPHMNVLSGHKQFFNKGSVITYSSTRKHYYEKTGSYTVSTQDTLEISLDEDPHRDLSVKPNIPGLIIHCLVNGTTLFYTSDYSLSQGVVELGDNVECSAGAGSTYYYSKDDSTKTYYPWYVDFTVEDDNYFEPEMSAIPPIDGSYINTKNTESAEDFLKNYYKGYYLMQLWGGTGGQGSTRGSDSSGTPGSAGYVYGVIYLDYEEEITYMLGGNGSDNTASRVTSVKNLAGGANGGGKASVDDSYLYVGGAGGGWSSLNKRSDNSIILLAGGGGGASGPGGSSGGKYGGNGGNGGSILDETKYRSSYGTGTIFFGHDGTLGELSGTVHGNSIVAYGGTTVAGYNNAYPEKSKYQPYAPQMQGGSLYGGNSLGRGGGGGAGLFGGAGGFSEAADTYSGTVGHARTSGGGGGSSFIEGFVTYQNLPASVMSYLSSNPSSTGGGLIITYLGETMPTS